MNGSMRQDGMGTIRSTQSVDRWFSESPRSRQRGAAKPFPYPSRLSEHRPYQVIFVQRIPSAPLSGRLVIPRLGFSRCSVDYHEYTPTEARKACAMGPMKSPPHRDVISNSADAVHNILVKRKLKPGD